MLDVQQAAEMLVAAAATTDPGHVKPLPTVIPNPIEYQGATEVGFRTLWVVFAIFVITSIVFTGLSWRVPTSRSLYYVVTTLITTVAALSYFAMAAGDGVNRHCTWTTDPHDKVPDTHHTVCRQVYWARYVDWSITTPLLLLDLGLLAGINGAHTLQAIIADVIMVLTGLFAAYGREGTAQKWGWYTIAVLAYLAVIYHIAVAGYRTVRAKGTKVVRLFSGLAIFTFVLWTAYPIVWAIADGARKVSVDTEIIAYAVLDVLAKAGFGFWLLISHRAVPETNIEVEGYWTHGLSADGQIRIGDDEAA